MSILQGLDPQAIAERDFYRFQFPATARNWARVNGILYVVWQAGTKPE